MKEKDVWIFKDIGKRNLICYTAESIRHPAKMELNMCREIIKRYSNEGDLILDPMCGIGSTIVEGMILNRNVIGVEYESKFSDLAEQNIEKVNKSMGFMNSLGKGQVINGDSRELYKLIEKVDKDNIDNIKKYGDVDTVLFSPPFADANTCGNKNQGDKQKKQCESNSVKGGSGFLNKIYSENPDNIGNLKHGDIDTVFFSPPFEGINNQRRNKEDPTAEKNQRDAIGKRYSDDPKNIGNKSGKNYLTEMLKIYLECFKVLKGGKSWCECQHLNSNGNNNNSNDGKHIDSVHSRSDGRRRLHTNKSVSRPLQSSNNYRSTLEMSKSNVKNNGGISKKGIKGNLLYKKNTSNNNSNIQSSRHKEILKDGSTLPNVQKKSSTESNKLDKQSSLEKETTPDRRQENNNQDVSRREINKGNKENSPQDISQNNGSIESGKDYSKRQGQSDKYIKNCQKCGKEIKPYDYWNSPGKYDIGFLVLVVKNFVRAGVQVRLDLDTIKLCEKAGFSLHCRHYRKIKNPSFWITNAIQKFEKKFPGKQHPYPLVEDILVFKK